jgi:hypothetical protein
MNPVDQLVHTTVRIETFGPAGQGSGTGFVVSFCAQADGVCIPAIVTNKHVIDGAQGGHFLMTKALPDGSGPDLGQKFGIQFPLTDWLMHPEPEVDLAVLPIGGALAQAAKNGEHAFYRSFTPDLIADDAYLNDLNAIEDILMIGYPNGLWDAKSNYPVVRRGITATPPGNRFNGRAEFVVDCACFPGSSGSPILLFNPFSFMDKQGNSTMGSMRVKLLGVLWGGPQFNAIGELQVAPVPTTNAASKAVALSRIPMNLGYCVRAEELKWFDQHFEEVIDKEKAAQASNSNDDSRDAAA